MLVVTSLQSLSADLASSGAESTSSADLGAQSTSLMSQIQDLVSIENLNQILGSIVGAVGRIAAQFFAVMMIFIFMLSALIMTPVSNQIEKANDSPFIGRTTELTRDVQKYLSITTLINFLVGLGNAIFLLILGVPFPFLWGIFSWFTGYIPAVGFWLAMIPPVLIAWTTIDLRTASIVFVGFILINGSVKNLVKPRIMGQGLNMSPLIVFISLFVWS